MKRGLRYFLIFGIIGIILGYFLGPFFYIAPKCNIDAITGEMEACMGTPTILRIPGAIVGLIIGGIISLIAGRFKK